MDFEAYMTIEDLMIIYRMRSKQRAAFHQKLSRERTLPPELRTVPDPISWHSRPLLWRPIDVKNALDGKGVRVDDKAKKLQQKETKCQSTK